MQDEKPTIIRQMASVLRQAKQQRCHVTRLKVSEPEAILLAAEIGQRPSELLDVLKGQSIGGSVRMLGCELILRD